MNLEFLKSVREFELAEVMAILAREVYPGAKILEIGAGTGWQASALAQAGYEVQAIDLRHSAYAPHRVWPITDYDGRRIPFSDDSFDVVFSSNVMEHIPHVASFQTEMQRVLKPEGISIHLIPSASWRTWTTLVHYFAMVGMMAKTIRMKWRLRRGSVTPDNQSNEILGTRTVLQLLTRGMVPSRHGEVGNVITETYYFSERRWRCVFEQAGWRVMQARGNGVFYTGHLFCGALLSLKFRSALSGVLGSACRIYMLRNDRRSL